MRVFVTGGTGYLGSAIVAELRKGGHRVSGLARSDESAARLSELGAEPVRGDLHEPSSYDSSAAEHDVIIHAAFDLSEDGVAADLAAIRALLEAAVAADGSRSLIYTSGVWVLGNTGETPADESAPTDDPAAVVSWRPTHEETVLSGATNGLATAVVRPGMVYGGRRGLFARFFESAVETGAAEFIGVGTNRWSIVHRGDVARLYRLVAEQHAGGIFHAVDGHPLPLSEVARAASEAASQRGRTRSIALEEARKRMGVLADALCLDQVVLARRSSELGWAPEKTSFRENAKEAFQEWSER